MKHTNMITQDILREIDDINRKCHSMHIPAPPVQFITAEVFDANHKILERFTGKSNSWVRNAYNMLAQQFLPCDGLVGASVYGPTGQFLKDTGGNARTTNVNFATYAVSGALSSYFNANATSLYGIVIGTGETAESFESNALAEQINHGTDAGQILYAIGTAPTVSYDSGLKKWTSLLTRNFTNSSGGEIVVKEVGLVLKMQLTSQYNVLISRDVIAAPLTVSNGQTLAITYTSEITYPA